jgi:uncharacterized membrane protein YbhN (UPF0104 family)
VGARWALPVTRVFAHTPGRGRRRRAAGGDGADAPGKTRPPDSAEASGQSGAADDAGAANTDRTPGAARSGQTQGDAQKAAQAQGETQVQTGSEEPKTEAQTEPKTEPKTGARAGAQAQRDAPGEARGVAQRAEGRRAARKATAGKATARVMDGSRQGGEEPPDGVTVDEPSLPARIRRPADLIRFLVSLGALALILLLANLARGTTSGLQSDIVHGTAQAPHLLLTVASLASSLGVLLVPAAFALERLLHRDGLRIAVGVLAAGTALAVTLALDEWASGLAVISDFLVWPQRQGGGFPGPAHIDITPVIAFVTAVRLAGRQRWQLVVWSVVGLDALAALAAGYVSAFTLVTTYIIGRAIGYGVLYLVGGPNTRPPGTAVVAALRRVGLAPQSVRRLPDGPEDARRYRVVLADAAAAGGGVLDITVLDRDQQAAGLLYRLWRHVRLRGPTPRRTLRSLRRSLEQESLIAYAATAAGVRTPRLVATSEIGSEAALLAYEHVPGRTLDHLPDDEITEELLTEIWEQLRLLQANRLAHRGLDGESILVAANGERRAAGHTTGTAADGAAEGSAGGEDRAVPYLVDLRAGEIAASDLVLRLDLAQLLTSLALRVGPERAVRSAADAVGIDALTASVPLLQRVALSRSTRAALRRVALRREGNLLARLREQVLSRSPRTEPEPVRLERFRLRTLVSLIAGTAATYLLLSQLSHLNLGAVLAGADWVWAVAAAAAAALAFPAAALMLIGYVPERLPFGRTVLVQLAGSFLRLVTPATVSAVAVNTRFLQRSGVPPGQAVASVGASQAGGLVLHVPLLALLGFITGTQRTPQTPDLPPSQTIVVAVVAVAVLAIVVTAVPPLRRLVTEQARSMFAGVVPRLLDVLQSPKKLCTGVGGSLLLTLAFVLCLQASILAFGGSIGIASVAVVFLAGNAIGSAAPTPGGLGAVEGALTLGLTLSGLPAGTAASAVLLFRLLTFWLPVLPGWAAFAYLQRKEAI